LLGTAAGAQALPSNEVETAYYSDASRTDEVGGFIRGCDGSLSAWGKQTRYATRTSTPFAFSHDAINRYLMEDDVSPNTVWPSIGHLIRRSGNASPIFDDTVLDKHHSFKIELVRSQYSGNKHGIIKGIGVVNCLYVNLDTNEYWIIDWRIYDPDGDGKTKLDHVRDMFDNAVASKNLPSAQS
jgi:hypothetical protein